jgi:hypothetical protein
MLLSLAFLFFFLNKDRGLVMWLDEKRQYGHEKVLHEWCYPGYR